MLLRRAKLDEFERIRSFYWNLIDRMQGKQNTSGWIRGIYPSDQFLMDSLKNGELYLMDDGDRINASVVLNNSWNEGYEGVPWKVDCAPEEVLAVHALAVNPDCQNRGVGKAVVGEILKIAEESGKKAVRLDILTTNKVAERMYRRKGFYPLQTKVIYYDDTGWTEYTMMEHQIGQKCEKLTEEPDSALLV